MTALRAVMHAATSVSVFFMLVWLLNLRDVFRPHLLIGAAAAAAAALASLICFRRDLSALETARDRYKDMQETLDAIIDASPLAILSVDTSGNVTWWSAAAERLFGWTEEEVIGGQNPAIPKSQRPLLHDLKQRTLRGDLTSGLETLRVRKDGAHFHALVRSAPIHDRQGAVIGMMGIVADITEHKKAVESLKASEERFRRLAENASDMIFRIVISPERRLEYISPAVESILGYRPDELMADYSLVAGAVDPSYRPIIDRLLAGGAREGSTIPITFRHKNGASMHIEVKLTLVRDIDGRITAIEGIGRDVTDRRAMEEQLLHISTHDSLTGLHNRRCFEAHLASAWKASRFPVAVIISDIDGLKLINDTLGHSQGDHMLTAYAALLQQTVGDGGVVARIGGDEFAALFPETDVTGAESTLARIEAAVEAYNSNNPPLLLSVSLGLAVSGPDATSLDELLSQADRNMYRDKIHRTTTAAHGIVKSLLAALAAKDYISEGHASRVSRLACMLGEESGLSKKELSDLALLAEVHDLGKVGTPDRILFKRGPLTEKEREEVKQHSTVGFKIARSSPELSHIAELILHHHEWWNGQGYPLGKMGQDIPVQCRILAIVDAYDAMTNDRPYRRAMTPDTAIEELKACAGKQFDPVLVDRFERLKPHLSVEESRP